MLNALKYTLYWRILIVLFTQRNLKKEFCTQTQNTAVWGKKKLTLETLVLPQKSAAGMNT